MSLNKNISIKPQRLPSFFSNTQATKILNMKLPIICSSGHWIVTLLCTSCSISSYLPNYTWQLALVRVLVKIITCCKCWYPLICTIMYTSIILLLWWFKYILRKFKYILQAVISPILDRIYFPGKEELFSAL